MSEQRLQTVIEAIDGFDDDDDVTGLAAYLDEHEQFLRAHGSYKLLAFANFRAKRVEKAQKYLKRVSREDLDSVELRLATEIRHLARIEKRLRLGLPLPSNKRFSRRLIDGALNLLRHGRLRRSTSSTASLPGELRAVGAQMQLVRRSNVRQLKTLLDRHEEQFRNLGRGKFLAFNYYHAGCLSKAAEHMRDVDAQSLSPDEVDFAANIDFEYRALERMRAGSDPIALERPTHLPRERPARLNALYLAAGSRPFLLNGYTSRTGAMMTAMRDCARFTLVPATRPGFPTDRSDAQNLSQLGDANLPFKHFASEAPYRGDLERYIDRNLDMLAGFVEENDIGLVHGVSNYRNGAIGLALARRVGVPFVYEMRGLWEETTDTKLKGWRDTERFEFERAFERFLARSADGVLVINDQVAATLGLEEHRNVRILPNCVSEDAVVEHGARPAGNALSIGYIGSILEYEGLDDLVQAVASLQEAGHPIELHIYGRGPDTQRLRGLIRDLGVSGISLDGVVDPAQVPQLYATFDLCVFPRKPYRVCQLVTPLKPVEAMANDVNVLVSDVAPMTAFSVDGATLSFEAGNVRSLAQAIEEFLAMDAGTRSAMRERARSLLRSSYLWERQCDVIADVYDAAFGKGALP